MTGSAENIPVLPVAMSDSAQATVIDIQQTLSEGGGFPPIRIHDQAGANMNLVRILPGQGPEPHNNAAGFSSLLVLSGSVHFRCGEETINLSAGQLVLVPPGVLRGFQGGDKGADLLALHLPPAKEMEMKMMSEEQNAAKAAEDIALDVREIPHAQRHTTVFSVVEKLEPGQALVITNDHDPAPLGYQLRAMHGDAYGWDYLEQGPEAWRVAIRRQSQD